MYQRLNDQIIFSAVKGLVSGSMLIVREHFKKKFNVQIEKIELILGPYNAEEVAMKRMSYLTSPAQILY